jgi:hypothetical protein
MDKDEIILRMRDILATFPQLRVAYLYGSFLSRDDFRDLDLALLIDNRSGEENTLKFTAMVGDVLEEALGFSHECDIRVLNNDPIWFRYEIISTGIPLYIKNADDRFDFETDVLIEYQDIKYMYDLFDRKYLAQV